MAVNYSSVAEKIFRVLNGAGLQLKMYDNQEGSEVANPQLARFFYVQQPNIMVNLDDKNAEIKMHKGPADIDEIQKIIDLLRNTAKTNLLDFDLREFGREIKPKNYAFRLNTNTMTDNIQTESLSGLVGTVKTSSQRLENAKLLIKHRKPVNEEVPGSRSRNISALYIENADGERFKYPYIHLNGARAMTRHVQSGGTPYDEVGQSVINMSEQLSKIREVLTIMRRSPAVQEQAASVMSSLLVRQDKLRETIKRITSMEGYKNYTENFVAKVNAEITPDAINSMKEKFTVTNVDNRIQELIPMINEIHDEENTLNKLRGAVQTKLGNLDFHEPTEKDVDTMPIQFTNDAMRVAARLALVAKLAKDDEVSGYLARMAAKLRGEDKEPAGGTDADDKRPYTKDDVQVVLKMLDDAKVKAIIKQVETGKMKMIQNPGDDAYDKAVAGESVLPEFTKLDEAFENMLGVFSPNTVVINTESHHQTGDPQTDFTKWLKDKYNKTPRDLTAKEYSKMANEFKEQNKKDESMETEAKGKDHNNDGKVDSADYMAARDKAIKKSMGNKQEEAVDVDAPARRDALKNKYANILKPIAQQEDFSKLYDITSDYKNDELFTYLHDKMNDIMADHGLHPKDDMEDIEMRLMDELKDDYGIAEASELDILKKNAGIQSEDESVEEGGNDFDIAMGDAEKIISDASSDEEAKADLQKLHDMQDDSYAKSTVADYIARLEKEGLGAMQSKLAMADNAGTQESAEADTNIARMQELINYRS